MEIQKEKSGYLIALIVIYSLGAFKGAYTLVEYLINKGFSDVPHLTLYLFWFVACWVLVILLGKRKKIAYWLVVAFVVTQLLSLIISDIGNISYIDSLPAKAHSILRALSIIQLVIPFIYLWLVSKAKKVLIN